MSDSTKLNQYREMVRQFVACMVPHPTEHPTMYAAWVKGKELLASDDGVDRISGKEFLDEVQKLNLEFNLDDE